MGRLLVVAAAMSACARGGFDSSPGPCEAERGCSVLVGSWGGEITPRLGQPSTALQGPFGCPGGMVLTGLYTEYESADRLRGFRLRCHALDLDVATGRLVWGEGAEGGERFGSRPLDYSQTLDCPDDELVTAVRAYVGALEPDPDDLRVMDRVEIGCSWLEYDGTDFISGEPLYVAQVLSGSDGLTDNNQIQDTAACEAGQPIVQITTSGGGHTDHLDLQCASLFVRVN